MVLHQIAAGQVLPVSDSVAGNSFMPMVYFMFIVSVNAIMPFKKTLGGDRRYRIHRRYIFISVFFVTLFLNVPIALCLAFPVWLQYDLPWISSCGYHADHVRQYK
jgi:hypothetical protein